MKTNITNILTGRIVKRQIILLVNYIKQCVSYHDFFLGKIIMVPRGEQMHIKIMFNIHRCVYICMCVCIYIYSKEINSQNFWLHFMLPLSHLFLKFLLGFKERKLLKTFYLEICKYASLFHSFTYSIIEAKF